MEVKVFSTPGCPWCVKVKQFLEEKKVAFEDIDVATDMEQAKFMVEKSGQRGVPVIMVDERVIVGFDTEALTDALKL